MPLLTSLYLSYRKDTTLTIGVQDRSATMGSKHTCRPMTTLYRIQEETRLRAGAIASSHGDWPCRKGCDECCRSLAAVPRISREEWQQISAAIDELPGVTAQQARQRIRAAAALSRPIVCPLLDLQTGACLVYHARPVACRAYGFYAERDRVLGCGQIESVAAHSPDVVWGNQPPWNSPCLSLVQPPNCTSGSRGKKFAAKFSPLQ